MKVKIARQARVQRVRDAPVEAMKGFAAENPFESITQLQPLGLIDKEGQVVLDSETRQAVSQYWKEITMTATPNWIAIWPKQRARATAEPNRDVHDATSFDPLPRGRGKKQLRSRCCPPKPS